MPSRTIFCEIKKSCQYSRITSKFKTYSNLLGQKVIQVILKPAILFPFASKAGPKIPIPISPFTQPKMPHRQPHFLRDSDANCKFTRFIIHPACNHKCFTNFRYMFRNDLFFSIRIISIHCKN